MQSVGVIGPVEVQRCGLPSRGNISENSIDKDTHHEGIGKRGTMKYLRESCYHRIECSVANSLTVLTWK